MNATYNHTMPNFDLNISVLEIQLTAIEHIHLPEFPGSKLEGAFGRALYAMSCTRKDLETCHPCQLRNICPYGNLYAPSLPKSMNVKSLEKPPRPILFATGTGGERKLDKSGHFIVEHDLHNHGGELPNGIAEGFVEFAKTQGFSFWREE